MMGRFINWVHFLYNGNVPEDETHENLVVAMIDMLASIVIWLVLYFFIFEMKIVKDKLLSQNPEEYRLRNQSSVTSRNITIFSVLFISVTIWILHLLFILSRASTMPLWSCIVDFVFRVCKILIDSYVLVTFLDLQSFFIAQKSVQLEIRD
jgi:hypothetical protein